ncbi:MAG: hypothetical protein JW807_13690 [Spirochaetes bacterium]|nr:hypothetical protein [Spirochaetota bacterium]
MELTKNETIMKYTALVYAVVFIVAVLVFIVIPEGMLGAMNDISRALFPSLPLAADSGKFWLSLTVSMMATITALSLLIYRDVRSNYRMAVPLVTAKFTSSLLGLGFFLAGFACVDTAWNTLANLIILFSDFPLGVLMLVLYLQVRRERA